MSIDWIFFDVGDVLFDENVPHLYYFHSLLLAMRRNGVQVEWDEYHSHIQACVRERPATAITDAARAYVPESELWEKIYREGRKEYEAMRAPRPYGLLLDDITPVLRDLRDEYRLGIIANQHAPVVGVLDDYGIGTLFDVKVIDEIEGVSKPDPEIFRLALSRAGCCAREAIMIGDRPDSDIAPANGLGMATIRFRRGLLYALYDPRTEEERADLVVRETSRLPLAVRKLAAGRS